MSSAKPLQEAAKQLRWYHWLGGTALAGAANVAFFGGMCYAYRWYFADQERELKSFKSKYGMPSEQQRLELIAWLAPKWDHSIGKVEETGANRYRTELFAKVRGDVLEVAVGTGRCFEAMPKEAVKSYVGVDIVQAMLDVTKEKLLAQPFVENAHLVRADVSQLPFPDGSFDTVMGSLCLCSLEDPAAGLKEIARVCRQDGQVLFVEPGIAENWIIRAGQEFMGFIPNAKLPWEVGWYDDRDPPALLRAAGLQLVTCQAKGLGNWYLLEAKPRAGPQVVVE